MPGISFEAIIKGGYIKLPDQYANLNDHTVHVEIQEKDNPKDADRRERLDKFIHKYKGLLKGSQIPGDIDIKKIRAMRIRDKYGT